MSKINELISKAEKQRAQIELRQKRIDNLLAFGNLVVRQACAVQSSSMFAALNENISSEDFIKLTKERNEMASNIYKHASELLKNSKL